MHSGWICHFAIIAGLLLGASSESYAQTPTAAPADVGTIADIVRTSYEVISGPTGAPRQWQRDRTLYMPGATFVSVSESDGRVQATIRQDPAAAAAAMFGDA